MPVSRQRKINRARKRPHAVSASAFPVSAHRPRRKRFNVKILVIVMIVAVAASAVAYVVARKSQGNEITTASGLKYEDLKVGDGATPQMGQRVRVHYVGRLANGREFENSYNSGPPAEFDLGPGLIAGWNETLQTMKVGGKRRITLPPNLAYGADGRPPKIPPNSTLTFEIELLGVG